MQFLDNAPRFKRRAGAAVFVFSLLMLSALGQGARGGSINVATDQTNINGVWSGELVERDADGNPKSHGYLYLRAD